MKRFSTPSRPGTSLLPVDPMEKELNQVLTTLYSCRECLRIKGLLARYVARQKSEATARRLAAEVYSEKMGQRAYEGYRDHTGGVSLATGGPIPAWADLPPAIRAAWGAAAKALLNEVPQ